jgi:HK97 gp10 family phage protein
VTTVVHGIPEALAALERRKIAAKVATPIAARAGGQVVQGVAQAIAPKDTGTLAASITVEMEGDDAQIGPTVEYARFTNFGTRYISAQHYMESAAAAASSVAAAAMAAVYKIAMK